MGTTHRKANRQRMIGVLNPAYHKKLGCCYIIRWEGLYLELWKFTNVHFGVLCLVCTVSRKLKPTQPDKWGKIKGLSLRKKGWLSSLQWEWVNNLRAKFLLEGEKNLGCRGPWPRTLGSSSQLSPWPRTPGSSSQPFRHRRSLALSATAPDLGHGVTPLGCRPSGMGSSRLLPLTSGVG